MGSPSSETGRGGDETEHSVTLSHGFYLGKHEVTQAQYETIMTGNPEGLNVKPSNWPNNNDRPVEKVSWNDAQIFLSRLIRLSRPRVGYQRVGNMFCPRRPSGSMPAGQARPRRTRGAMILIPPVPTIIGMELIIQEMILSKLVMWGSMRPTPGAFLTCREMCGNGSATGRRTILPVPRPIPRVRHRARFGSDGVVPGRRRGALRSARRYSITPELPLPRFGFRVGFQPVQPDTANPELELFGGARVTREAGQAWAEPGAAGHDARDGNLTASITVTGTVDMNTTGTYVLTYSVADAAGNEANASRTVTVVDTTHPVLTLLGDANMSQAKDSAWVDPGATASDSLDGNLTSSITITGTVDVNTTGVYTLTYSVSDGASNEANATRVVNVGQASTHNADLNATVQLQMLWVEPGTFTMGSPTTETGRQPMQTEHNVTLTKGFYLGKYEVTQAQYEAVMTGNTDSLSATPSEWPNNPNRPVEKVSWADAQIFLTRLNAQQSGKHPRLVGPMSCPPSRNGNMPAVQVRRRCIRGEMILIHRGQIITGMVPIIRVSIAYSRTS